MDKTYIGKINNTASQYVEAPIKPVGLKGKTKVVKGDDLRAAKSKG